VFRLIKLALWLVGVAAFAWFGVTVKLGEQTLFQHLRAIGQTKESQELVDGTRQAAGPLVDDVKRRFGKQGEDLPRLPAMPPDAGAPQERLSSSEQRQLRALLDKARDPQRDPHRLTSPRQ
jgi:hypothetical protein